MGRLLGWDAARVRDELARHRALAERLSTFTAEGASAPAAVAAQAANA
jgi:hypothetical protein